MIILKLSFLLCWPPALPLSPCIIGSMSACAVLASVQGPRARQATRRRQRP
jgi:hypothetical protein